ncbi:MAG TPA: dephospho-CoA kinase [Oscillatoriales cyanobacterium M59_W2019_021]|nr:MAG: dephospho-CoA kinase [Cyanobacteria bacterium J055]HIK29940.1 dephospho-CoA kinase [Oscillatoriales cyanobacterium M4454_W2019_049]HIK50186.1 dephospho-CoA kinase [Oscillatoriales cyanobacterium M59_W2019_021]
MTRIIGLTGGIATGKSTIAHHLSAAYHCPVFDADSYSRAAVAPGSEILDRIFQRYGDEIRLADGNLNRRALGAIVFANPDERQWLEAQIHPYVRQQFVEAILHRSRCARASHQDSQRPIILVIPLLFEAGMEDLVSEIWVVYCTASQQIERLIQRDRLTPEQAQLRIDAQMPLEVKCDQADLILDNSSTPNIWMQQIHDALHS